MPHGPSPFDRLDADHDGKLTKEEVLQQFAKIDVDGDGSITKEELMKSLYAATSQRPDAAPQTQGDHPPGLPESRGEHGLGRPPFGRGPMGRGPMNGGPMGRGPLLGGLLGQGPSGAAGHRGPPSPSALLEHFDQNKDGKLTKSELPEFLWDRLSKADLNGDGEITKDELEVHLKTIRPEGTSKPVEPPPADKAPPADKPAASA